MIKKHRIILSCILFLVSILLSASSVMASEDFGKVFAWLEQAQREDDPPLGIRAGDKTFNVLREELKPMAETAAVAAIQTTNELPSIKLSDDADIVVYPLSDGTRVECHVARAAPRARTWFKSEFTSLGEHPLTAWSDFMKEALGHGLVGTTAFSQPIAYLRLDFRRPELGRIECAGHTLQMTHDFYESMRTARNFGFVPGKEGFVVIVHEPHWSNNGQFQTVEGIRSLLTANPGERPYFQVEGPYRTGEGRQIGFNTLDEHVDAVRNGDSAAPYVFSLLANHVVDNPMTYRLIYDRSVPAEAIDDLRFLHADAYGVSPAGPARIMGSLQKVQTALLAQGDAVSEAGIRRALLLLTETLAYLEADGHVQGEHLIAYYKGCGTRMHLMAELARAIPGGSDALRAEGTFLDEQGNAYEGFAKTYEEADKRNEVMAQRIIAAAKAGNGKLPMAFIGSFHTHGITQKLREAHVGYVVIEERDKVPSTAWEKRSFERMLSTARESELRSITSPDAPKTIKSQVNLSEAEVTEYIAPYLERSSRKFAATEVRNRRQLTETIGSHFQYDALRGALDKNGSLANARVESGGGGSLPPRFDGAFASFTPGDGGGGGHLVIYDADGRHWSRDPRLWFLSKAVMTRRDVPGKAEFVQTSNYWHPQSKEMFTTVFDSTTGKYFLFETSKAVDVYTHSVPPKSDTGPLLMHLNIVENPLQTTNRNQS